MIPQADTAMDEPVRNETIRGFAESTPAERPLRVALCIDSLAVGGTELNAVRTAERLRARGIDAILLVLRAEGPLGQRCEQARIPMIAFPIPRMASPRSVVRGVELMRLFRRLRIDVVHTQDRYSNAFVVPWARLAGLRVLASRRWWDVHPSRALGFANRIAFRLAHGVVANSARVADLVQAVDGVSRDKVTIIPNFLDDAALEVPTREGQLALRDTLGVPRDALVIGCVANLRPVKDHRTLLSAFARVAAGRPHLVLCLVGDGALRPDLQQQTAGLGIAGIVVFSGTRSDAVNWHSAFDISVLTSLSEGFPNSVIEAMAAGRPVIATDVGGTPDAIHNEVTGFLVPPGGVEPLAHAMDQLLDNAGLRARMGQVGRAEAARRYHASVVLPAVEQLYMGLAGRWAGEGNGAIAHV
jgi:L-malate glycosyltransferase